MDKNDKILIKVHKGNYTFPSGTYRIEPDASTAAYDALIAVSHGFDVEIMNLTKSSIQGEFHFIQNLIDLGADVQYLENSTLVKGSSFDPR